MKTKKLKNVLIVRINGKNFPYKFSSAKSMNQTIKYLNKKKIQWAKIIK